MELLRTKAPDWVTMHGDIVMRPVPPPDRFERIVRLFRLLFGAALGAFIGVLTCLRMPWVAYRLEAWPWMVLPTGGLLIGVLVAWRGQQIRRFLQRWIWWFP